MPKLILYFLICASAIVIYTNNLQAKGNAKFSQPWPEFKLSEVPADYGECFARGDASYNANNRIDCIDEVIEAATQYAAETRDKEKFKLFMIFLGTKGYYFDFEEFMAAPGCLDNINIPPVMNYSDMPIDVDSISARRAGLIRMIRSTDTLVRRNFGQISDYESRGLALRRRIENDNVRKRLVSKSLVYGRTHNADYQERNEDENTMYISDKEEDSYAGKRAAVLFSQLDMQLFIDCMKYIAEGRKLVREQFVLFETKKSLKKSDQNLDLVSIRTMDDYEERLLNDGRTGVIAGLKQSAKERAMEKETAGHIADINRSMADLERFRQDTAKAVLVRDINDKLINLQMLFDKFAEKEEAYNRRLEEYQARVTDHLKLNGKLRKELEDNNEKYEDLAKRQESLRIESSHGFQKTPKEVWNHYSNIMDLKQGMWSTFKKCYEHDLLLSRLKAEGERLEAEREALWKVYDEYVAQKKLIDEEKNQIYERYGLKGKKR